MYMTSGKCGMKRHFFQAIAGLCMIWLMGYSTAALAADDVSAESEYRFFPCEILIKVTLEGLPKVDGIRLRDSVETCATGKSGYLAAANDDADVSERWNDSRDRMPKLSVTEHDGRFDIDVLWADAKPPIRYRGQGLAAPTRSSMLKSDAAGGPVLRVSIEPVSKGSHVGVLGMDIEAIRILDDLARYKALKFRNTSLLANAKIGLFFDEVSTRDLVDLIAASAQTMARPQGPSSYVFGRIANAAKIEALRSELNELPASADAARRKALLQKIVDLSKPNMPDEFPAAVESELQELANLAIMDQEYARAEVLMRARIKQLDFFSDSEGSATQAFALLELGTVLRVKPDLTAAAQALRQSLTMLDQHADAVTLPIRAIVYAELALVTLETGNLDESAKLADQAYAVLDSTDLPGWDKHQVDLARHDTASMAGRVGFAYWKRGDHASARLHLERDLALMETLHGQQDKEVDPIRDLVIMNFIELGDFKQAAEFQATQIAACLSRKDPLSEPYFDSMLGLVLYRTEQEDFAAALELWNRHVEVLRAAPALGNKVQVSALRDLALLQRLNSDVAKAQATERQAARLASIPGDPASNETAPSAIARSLMSRTLASELNLYYGRKARKLIEAGKVRDPAMAMSQWREVETLAAQDDISFAISELSSLKRILELSGATHSDIARQLPARMNELCALWEKTTPKKTIPKGACSPLGS